MDRQMKLESKRKKQLLIGIVVVIIVALFISLLFWNYSAPPAKIVRVVYYPSTPSGSDTVTVEVTTEGGTSLFSRSDLDIGFVTQNSQGMGTGGASLSYIGENTYQIELNPNKEFEDDTIVWYVIALRDRGETSFTDCGMININHTSSLPSNEIVVQDTSLLLGYDPTTNSESSVLLANISANFTIQRVEYSIVGFTSSGTFGMSGTVMTVENNTYIVPLGPEFLQNLKGATVFYNFSVYDAQGHFAISEPNSQTFFDDS